ncbi:MAG: alanine racemase [Coriobacteriales bacterium]|jgi:alanine racemase|nr:alanine racemase [Coriobacteriales bacterium]
MTNETRELSVTDRRGAWLEIDCEAIRFNLKKFRKHLGPDPRIMAVVKADGYGHGAIEVARVALATGATMLGVSNVTEGIELRRAGIAAPILVLAQPPATAIPLILKHQLIVTLYDMDFALALGETADAQGKAAPYHLKVDTGMNRIGVHYSDAGDFLHTVSFHRGLELQGVFTHFATADEREIFEFKKQYEHFAQAIENIRYMGISPGIIHAANTAAAIRFKQVHFDMVRIGIGMYGLHPSDLTKEAFELHPAMSVHTRVNCIKGVPVGEGVSYGYTYRSPGSVLIGTLPIGYGDGLARVLSNHMEVLIRGRRLPQVGRICMDMTMFEINQRSSKLNPRAEVELGDEAIIIGTSGNQTISLDDMARALGTINYELACRFALRLERVYLD